MSRNFVKRGRFLNASFVRSGLIKAKYREKRCETWFYSNGCDVRDTQDTGCEDCEPIADVRGRGDGVCFT